MPNPVIRAGLTYRRVGLGRAEGETVRVSGFARHAITGQELVYYRSLKGERYVTSRNDFVARYAPIQEEPCT